MDLVAREVEILEKYPPDIKQKGGKALQKRKGIQKYDPTYQMAKARKHGREGGKTRELVHTLHTLNCSLYALN